MFGVLSLAHLTLPASVRCLTLNGSKQQAIRPTMCGAFKILMYRRLPRVPLQWWLVELD